MACFSQFGNIRLSQIQPKKDMSQIGVLVTGAGVNTPLAGLAQMESNIVIGDVDTAMPLQGLKVIVDGSTKIDIQGSVPLVSTFAKFAQRISGAVVGLVLKIATGRINRKADIFLTNGGATTPIIYGYSDGGNGVPLEASTTTINALSNQTFEKFSGLFVTPSANVGSFDVVFSDGTQQNMSVVEADAYFASMNDTEANGKLDAVVTGFDNRGKNFKSVKVNATTAVTVMHVRLPQSYFNSLKN
jgi:hypothetical protein